MAATTYELIVKTVDQTSGPMGRITGGLGKGKIAFAAVAVAATAMGKAMIDASKQMETVQNQLRLVTKNSSDLAATQSRLTKLARDNRSTLGPTVELYTKLKVATAELGFSNERVEGMVTKLTQALVVAGADAGTTAGVIKQFGQAMASGTVRGDEFNSIVEGMGPALAIMAQESGITVGELREMSQAGELTAETFAGLLEGSTALTDAFNKMQTPLDTLEKQLSEAFVTYLANLSEASGATAAYRSILEGMINVFDAQNQAFLDAATPIGAMEIKLQQAKEALNQLKATAAGQVSILDNVRNSTGLLGDQTDDLGGSIREITPTMVDMTGAIADQEATVKALSIELDLMKFKEIEAAETAKFYAQQRAAAKKAEEEATAALQAAVPVLSQYEQFLANLIDKSRSAATQQGFQAKAIGDLRVALEAGQMSIDAYAIAMERLGQGTKAVKETIESATPAISEFDKFFNNLVDSASRSANQIIFKQQAVAKLDEALRLGRISIDTYAQAMLNIGNSADKTKDKLGETTQTISSFDQFMNDLVESSREAVTEQTHQMQAQGRLNEMLAAGKINLDQYAEAMRQIGGGTEINQEKQNITDFMSETEKLALNLEKTMTAVTDNLGMTIAQGIAEGKSLMDVLKNTVRQTLTQILGMILQSQINKALGGMFSVGGMGMGGFGGGGGGTMGMLFGIGRMFLGFENGGVPPTNRPSIVGEGGAELFMPGTTGRVVPNDELQGMMGAPTVNFNINAVDTQSGTEFILKNKRQIEGVIQNAYERRGRRGIA